MDQTLLDEAVGELRAMVALDGGDVELVSATGGTVALRLDSGRRRVPGVRHAQGVSGADRVGHGDHPLERRECRHHDDPATESFVQ